MYKQYKTATASLFFSILFTTAYASGTLEESEISKVKRAELTNDKQRAMLSNAAGLLADYEIMAKKLVATIDDGEPSADAVKQQAETLITLSEDVINSARFRLPQCDEYLAKTLELKESLSTISHEVIEKDYHQDGALPKAPIECYHTKDLIVHPATVVVLTRDDPSLASSTKQSIAAEINEVLAHTEVVRQLVIY